MKRSGCGLKMKMMWRLIPDYGVVENHPPCWSNLFVTVIRREGKGELYSDSSGCLQQESDKMKELLLLCLKEIHSWREKMYMLLMER